MGKLPSIGYSEEIILMNKLFSLALLLFTIIGNSQELKIYHKKSQNGFVLMADNSGYTPMSANIEFQLENLRLNGNHIAVVKPQKTKQVIGKLLILDRSKATSFSYKYTSNYGDTFLEDFDEDYEYALPFQRDSTYAVIQGYNGNFSHQGEEAIDFKMPVGTAVLAAREGTVVKVIENFDEGCPEKKCVEFGNLVRIMHADGTFADYLHLRFEGADVEEGQKVERGQLIGFSGNTGFSTVPHLHFMVYLQKIFARTTVPTLFKVDEDTAPLILEKGKRYTNNAAPLRL